jgi:hypothetical protein
MCLKALKVRRSCTLEMKELSVFSDFPKKIQKLRQKITKSDVILLLTQISFDGVKN